MDPVPSNEEIASFYPDQYYAYSGGQVSLWDEKSWRWAGLQLYLRTKGYSFELSNRSWLAQIASIYYRLMASKLSDVPRREWGDRYLDFGSGASGSVPLMLRLGWQAEGLDISGQAARTGQQLGLRIHHGSAFQHPFEAATFDFIYSSHSFEHLAKPQETLANLRELLKPGGRLLIRQPNAGGLCARFGKRWGHLTAPVHIHLHTRKSMILLAQQTGLLVESIGTRNSPTDMVDTLSLILGRSLEKPVRNRSLTLLMNFCAYPLSILDLGCDLVTLLRRPLDKATYSNNQATEEA
jgi:SAM-dependent methyltransferase